MLERVFGCVSMEHMVGVACASCLLLHLMLVHSKTHSSTPPVPFVQAINIRIQANCIDFCYILPICFFSFFHLRVSHFFPTTFVTLMYAIVGCNVGKRNPTNSASQTWHCGTHLKDFTK